MDEGSKQLKKACQKYHEWGALTKVDSLRITIDLAIQRRVFKPNSES
jgi:hypothetical protein